MITANRSELLSAVQADTIDGLREVIRRERAEHAEAIVDYRGTLRVVARDLEDRVCQVHRLHAALADRVGGGMADAVKAGTKSE